MGTYLSREQKDKMREQAVQDDSEQAGFGGKEELIRQGGTAEALLESCFLLFRRNDRAGIWAG